MRGSGVLFVGFAGPRLEREERALLRRLQPGGIVLVPRNIEDEPGLRALMSELRQLCPEALLALDAEGGRVDRLRDVVAPAPAADSLAKAPPRRAESAGRWIGFELRNLGFDLALAPVVDLDHGLVDNALDRRCYGSRPRAVTARARAFLRGLHRAGVGGCLKHFPGLGAAATDTHREHATVTLTRRRLARDLAPFVALAAEAETIMAGHAIYPALDPDFLPATLSPTLCKGLLRGKLGYRRALLSDDLEMGALDRYGDLPTRAERALVAGCDGLLFCRRLDAAPVIARRLERPALAERVRQATARLGALRRELERRRRAVTAIPELEEVRRRLLALSATTARTVAATRRGQL